MNDQTGKSAFACATCGKVLAAPLGHGREAITTLVEEESRRCSRLREITQQRQALVARMQAGMAGIVSSDTVDTIDIVAQRRSLTQLDTALKGEAESLAKIMLHVPKGQ